NRLRKSQRDRQDRYTHDESGDWTGDADIKQSSAGANRRADTDKSSKSSDQSRRRDEERQCCPNPITFAEKIVAHLVGQQYQHERGREGYTEQQARWMRKCPA